MSMSPFWFLPLLVCIFLSHQTPCHTISEKTTSSSLLVLTSSRDMCYNHCIVILQSFKLFLQEWFCCSIIFRIAKKKLDNRSFFGGILHVCYAPEFETVDDTREKLQERRKIIAKKTRGDWAHQLRL